MLKKYRVLVTAEIDESLLNERFGNLMEFEYVGYHLNHMVLPHDELVHIIGKYDILICEYDTVTKDVFDAAERLKLIVCCRGGVKSVIDLDEAKKRRIDVCHNIGRNASAVADMVVAYALDLTRNISKTNALIHSRTITSDASSKPAEYKDTVWGLDNDSPFIRFRGRSLNHMVLGLVGFGHAGKMVAKRAAAFGMKILAYDPYVDFGDAPEYVTNVAWNDLLRCSDIISLHCVLNSQTNKMFSKREFSAMKEGSYFINTSRGAFVVESDLVDALKNGHLSGAALDVTNVEPISSNSELLEAPNLILTPHIAGSSEDVQSVGVTMVCESLQDFLDGVELRNAA